jgi:WD40 repeat protein
VQFNDDGEKTFTDEDLIRIWDAESGDLKLQIEGNHHLRDFAFSGDSNRILIGGSFVTNHELDVWDIETGETSFINKPKQQITSTAFHPTENQLATGTYQGTIVAWDPDDGRELFILGTPNRRSGDGRVTGVEYSPDGKRIASGAGDGAVVLSEFKPNGTQTLLGKHDATVYRLRFSPDGKYLASAGHDRQIKIWNTETGELTRTLRSHPLGYRALKFGETPDRLMVVAMDGTVQVLNPMAPVGFTPIHAGGYDPGGAAISPDGRIVAAAAGGGASLWDLRSGEFVAKLEARGTSIAFSPRGGRVAMGTGTGEDPKGGGTVSICDTESGKRIQVLRGHDGSIGDVVYSGDGSRLASISHDRTARLWDAESGEHLLTAEVGSPNSVALSADGRRLAASARGSGAAIWNDAGEVLYRFECEGVLQGIQFSPDGRRLAAVASSQQASELHVWEIASQELLVRVPVARSYVFDACFSPDGKRIATCGAAKTVTIWDAERGLELLSLKGHLDSVYSVEFSADGEHLVTSDYGMRIRVWKSRQPPSEQSP